VHHKSPIFGIIIIFFTFVPLGDFSKIIFIVVKVAKISLKLFVIWGGQEFFSTTIKFAKYANSGIFAMVFTVLTAMVVNIIFHSSILRCTTSISSWKSFFVFCHFAKFSSLKSFTMWNLKKARKERTNKPKNSISFLPQGMQNV